jgi:glycosyltransferase involved in cell wall biosynthesis
MPVFNGCLFIEDAIESVLSQTYSNWELIIVDDGSSDNSYEIAKKNEHQSEKIKVFQHNGGMNKGVSTSRNLAIQKSQGLWISLLDSDDKWYPNKLEREAAIIKNNPDLVFIYSNALIIGKGESPVRNQEIYGSGICGYVKDPFKKLIKGFHVPTSGVSFAKSVFSKCKGFDEKLTFSEDTLLFHQLIEHGSLFYLNEVLSDFRFHTQSSSTYVSKEKRISSRLQVYFLLIDRVTVNNIKYVSKAIVTIGFKNILRNLYFYPYHKPKLLLRWLVRIMIHPKIKLLDKSYAVFLLLAETFLLPAKFIKFKQLI